MSGNIAGGCLLISLLHLLTTISLPIGTRNTMGTHERHRPEWRQASSP